MDSSISDCLIRMRRLATAIEGSKQKMANAELWMRLEHIHLDTLLTRRASYQTRPDIEWSWASLSST